MVDVARHAGVAHVTVSRVLNNPDIVREETRTRVDKAIEELGYRRNDVARTLKRGRSGMIGLIIAGEQLYELPRILLGVEQAAAEANQSVSMASWQSGDPDQLVTIIERLVGQAAEGITLVADRAVVAGALERVVTQVPMSVVMSGEVPNPAISSVEVDQERGAGLVVQHLVERGHRDIAHLTGRLSAFDATARLEGWRREMQCAGLREGQMLEGDFTARSGYELAHELMPALPSAIFAGNDQMALGALAAFAEHGVVVPRDVSLVGFDDMTGSDYLVPALTTVRQDFEALGRRSIQVLSETMAGVDPQHHQIDPELIVRASTRDLRPS